MTKRKRTFELTPELEAKMPIWVDMWKKIAYQTGPLQEETKPILRGAISFLYKEFLEPSIELDPNRIQFATSPVGQRFAYALAVVIIEARKRGKAINLPDECPRSDDPYQDNIWRQMWNVGLACAGGIDFKPAPTDLRPVVRANLPDLSLSSSILSCRIGPFVEKVLGGQYIDNILDAAADAYKVWQGGNNWSGWECFISFHRHNLDYHDAEKWEDPVDYTFWDRWETLARLGPPRLVHPEFVIFSDFPSSIKVNDRGQLHSDVGPCATWRDGYAVYQVNGVSVPAWLFEQREKLDKGAIDSEKNAEVRRIMMGFYGLDRYMGESDAKLVDDQLDLLGKPRRLWMLPDGDPAGGDMYVVELTDSSPNPVTGEHRIYTMQVNPELYGGDAGRNAHAAVASTWRDAADPSRLFFEDWRDYVPEVET